MKHPDTQLLRSVAMLLIFNSHMGSYYPIPIFSTGGALGNNLFFCLSAFGLYLSFQTKKQPFGIWLSNRLSRIYPSLWVVLLVLEMPLLLHSGKLNDSYVTTFIGYFFCPSYWFLRALMVYYVLSYFLLNDNKKNRLPIIMGILGILYFAIYFSWVDLSKWAVEDLPFKLIHCFMIYLFGIYLARKNNTVTYTGWHNLLFLVLLIMLIYGHKFLISRGQFLEFQFIQHAVLYPTVFYLLKVSRAPFVLSMLEKNKAISTTVNFIADHSLELYMVQTVLVVPVLKLNLPFPLNAIIFVSLTLLLSQLVKIFADNIKLKII